MPAIMGIYDGKKEGYFLYPGTDSVAGYSEAAYVLYWAACHRTATSEASRDSELSTRFAYRVSNPEGTSLKDFTFDEADDVLEW